MARPTNHPPGIEPWARRPLSELYADLTSGPNGLAAAEAARRLAEHGPNTLPEPKRPSLSRKALAQFKNLFNVLLVLAALLSFLTGWTSNDMSSVQLGFAILGVVVLSVLFSLFQERRAERAVEALRELVPLNARVTRDGKIVQVAVSSVVPGDVISLEEGDKVPADARLVTGYEVTADLSALTGESDPVPRSADPDLGVPRSQITEHPNLVFAGTTIASGAGTAIVLATGARTQFGQVVEMAREVQEPLSPLQRQLDHTAKLNFVVSLVVGFLFLGIALVGLRLSLGDSVLFMIGVIISLVPEGLQVTVTLSLALSSLAMSRRNVVVKRLSSVETLGSTTVICSDKTGTITQGQMTVRRVWLSGRTLEVSGDGYEPEGSLYLDGRKVTASDRPDLNALCEVAALDNRATLVPPLDRRKSRWTAVGDTTDAALLVLAAKGGLPPNEAAEARPRIGLIPFESSRKMMSSVHRDAKGTVTAYTKGAGLEVLSRCTTALWDGKAVPFTEEIASRVRAQIDAFARDAYRVLALATRNLPGEPERYESARVERDLTFVGLVAILDPPRPDVARAVRRARNAGMRVIMITGDHELTAAAIARKVGIITGPGAAVVTGYRLAEMSDDELSKVLESPEVVFARIAPDQKHRIVRALRARKEVVAVTGDGVNDAPALLEADIGIAMGITGTDVARESADMVLLDDNFASIVNGSELGRSVFDNLKKFITYVFSHNWAELVTFIAFVLLGTPLPLTVIMVLSIDLVMEIPPSLALTLEPPEPGIMDRPPRPAGSRLFDFTTLVRSFYLGTMIGIAALFWCFATWARAGWGLGSATVGDAAVYVKGTTMVLAAIIAGQLGVLFSVRTDVESTFRLSPLRNPSLVAGAIAEFAILLVLVYVPPAEWIVHTAPLAPVDWMYLYSIVPLILLFEEMRKLVVRRVVLPAKAAGVPGAGAPPAAKVVPATQETAARAAFVERARPILLPLFVRPGEESAVAIAVTVARREGSRLIVVRVPDPESSDAMQDAIERRLRDLAGSANVPFGFADVIVPGGPAGVKAMVGSLRRLADENRVNTIIVPVRREVLAGGRAARAGSWIEGLSDRRLILVGGPRGAGAPRPRRVLIPVLREFAMEPFEVAASISASSVVPDVDVVAARVIRLPPIVPIYSTYRPESLVDSERELSSLREVLAGPFLWFIKARVLIVREIARDLVDFADERHVDAIILQGDWSEARRGFLAEDEREIARRAKAAIVVTLPARERPEAGG